MACHLQGPNQINGHFLTRSCMARSGGRAYFVCWNKEPHPRILCLAKPASKNEGKVKTLQDKQKWKGLVASGLALQDKLQGVMPAEAKSWSLQLG